MPPGTDAATAASEYQDRNMRSTKRLKVSDAVDIINGEATLKTSQ
jgi:hypothetical protein